MQVRNAVVVVTGASSGVGRATALAFADAGARLVLAARGSEALDAAAAECAARGAEVLSQPTDVADAAAVERLAQAAVARFGRVDVWASIAGVGAVGPFLATPLDEHDLTVRTDLLGPLYGAYAALKRFDAQREEGRGEGIILHMSSVGAFAAAPYGVAYSAAKFGLRGLSLALRGELAAHPGVRLCEVYASFLDTPGVAHAADRLGAKLRPAPLVNDPDRIARIMVELVRRPRDEVMSDLPAALIRLGAGAAPRFTSWALGRVVEVYARVAEPRPGTDGAVRGPAAGRGAVHGGLRSTPLRAGAAVGVGLVGVAAGLALLAAARRVRRPAAAPREGRNR